MSKVGKALQVLRVAAGKTHTDIDIWENYGSRKIQDIEAGRREVRGDELIQILGRLRASPLWRKEWDSFIDFVESMESAS